MQDAKPQANNSLCSVQGTRTSYVAPLKSSVPEDLNVELASIVFAPRVISRSWYCHLLRGFKPGPDTNTHFRSPPKLQTRQESSASDSGLERLLNDGMALPYPEGAVYFRRSALRLHGYGYNFDVQRDTDFYSHFLLENVWNYWAFSPNTTPNVSNVPTHPRSRVLTGTASSYRTRFG